MNENDIQTGGLYLDRLNRRIRIDDCIADPKGTWWLCTNIDTRREVVIRSAKKLIRPIKQSEFKPIKLKSESI